MHPVFHLLGHNQRVVPGNLLNKGQKYIAESQFYKFIKCVTQDYKLGICCFSAKHLALKRKNKDGLVHNQDNVSSWSDIYSPRLLLQ